MTYIILAAGKGVRAKSDITNIPKALLKGVDGKSLLVNTLEKIDRHSNDKHVHLVTGFLSEQINQEIAAFNATPNTLSIDLLQNNIYEQGVITSFWTGIRTVDDSAVILNGDTIYSANILEEISGIEKTTLLVAPAKDIPDSIKVITHEDLIVRVGKKLGDYSHISASCLFLENAHVLKLVRIIDRLMKSGNIEKIIWHEMINDLIDSGEKVLFKEMREGNTIEVDTEEDYQFLLEQQRKQKENG